MSSALPHHLKSKRFGFAPDGVMQNRLSSQLHLHTSMGFIHGAWKCRVGGAGGAYVGLDGRQTAEDSGVSTGPGRDSVEP